MKYNHRRAFGAGPAACGGAKRPFIKIIRSFIKVDINTAACRLYYNTRNYCNYKIFYYIIRIRIRARSAGVLIKSLDSKVGSMGAKHSSSTFLNIFLIDPILFAIEWNKSTKKLITLSNELEMARSAHNCNGSWRRSRDH